MSIFAKNIIKLKKLYRYIIRSYIGTFFFTFFVAVFILLMQFLWCYIDDFVGKGLEVSVILKLLFYTSITFVPMALPLAILLSSLMCFGKLGEYYELVAMKASGISIWKIMRPLLVFSVIMSFVAFFFSNNVLPYANLKSQSLLYDVRHQKMALDIPEGVFYRGIDDYVIRVGKKGDDGNSLYDVMIYDHSDGKGNVKVTTADSGYIALSKTQKEMIFTLYDGCNYTEMTDDKDYRVRRPFQTMFFKKQYITFDLSEFDLTRTDEDLFKSHHSMLNIAQLNVAIDSLNKTYDKRVEKYDESFKRRFHNLVADDEEFVKHDKMASKKSKEKVENDNEEKIIWPLLDNFTIKEQTSIVDMALSSTKNIKENIDVNVKEFNRQKTNILKHEQVLNQKFSLSVACLIFFFIGAPLGAIIRKGGLGLPVVVSVVFFVIYYIMTITCENIALAGDMPMFLGVWLSSIVLFPIGVFLTFKATTDGELLDGESWKKTFDKIFTHKNR